MVGVPIYTESPITPVKPAGITPQTVVDRQTHTAAPNQAPNGASRHLNYPPPPRSGLPAATTLTPTSSRYEPPPPQPGAVPSASSASTVTAKPSVPPPPRVGEVPKPPEYYAPHHSTAPIGAQRQSPYPPQMMLSMAEPSNGQPPSSTTSSTTTFTPALIPSKSSPFASEYIRPTPTSSFSSGNNDNTKGPSSVSLEHPPGYVQNPFASTELPEHRRFASQQTAPLGSRPLGLGGYAEDKSSANATTPSSSGFEDEESVWGMAKKWAKGASDTVGTYVTDINEKISRNLDNGK